MQQIKDKHERIGKEKTKWSFLTYDLLCTCKSKIIYRPKYFEIIRIHKFSKILYWDGQTVKSQIVKVSGFADQEAKLRILCRYFMTREKTQFHRYFINKNISQKTDLKDAIHL